MSTKGSSRASATPLLIKGEYETVDLPEENRSGVLKIENPSGWYVACYKLGKFKDQLVNITFTADVKRVGATGDLRWQVSNRDYPVVGDEHFDAEEDTWYTFSGEWTGSLIHNRVFYLSTYHSNSKETTYYIDNFSIEVETIASYGTPVKREKREDGLAYQPKALKDMASYLKGLIPASIPTDFSIMSMFQRIADEERIRSGVLAYRDFLHTFCDRLIADSHLYDKAPKNEDSHASIAARYPILHSVKNVLLNLGYHGKPADNGTSLLLSDWQSLILTTSSDGGQAASKLSVPKVMEELRFLSSCGLHFDGIDLEAPKPGLPKGTSLTVTYPGNPAMLTGLRVMAAAQKELNLKDNGDLFLRCDYSALQDGEADLSSMMQDFVRPLPAEVQDFALRLHQRFTDLGFTCTPKVFNFNVQIIYSYNKKEVWSFFASLIAGYRIVVKAQNTQKYADIIEDFPPSLRGKIAKGYGCDRSKFDEPCQKGCHGFSFSLNDSILELSEYIDIWLDQEFSCLRKGKNPT